MSFSQRLSTKIIGSGRGVAFCVLALALLLSAGTVRLQISTDAMAFLGEDNPDYRALIALNQTYTLTDPVVVLAIPPVAQAFTPDMLTALRAMVEDAWQTPFVLRVDALTTHLRPSTMGEEDVVIPMVPEQGVISALMAQQVRDIALADTALHGSLMDKDGTAFALIISLRPPDMLPDAGGENALGAGENTGPNAGADMGQQGLASAARTQGESSARTITEHVRAQTAAWDAAYPNWQFYSTGAALGAATLAQAALDDMEVLIPAALLMTLLILIVTLRAGPAIWIVQLVLVLATLSTFGFAGWIGLSLTPATAISPLAVLVLVSTSCVHLIVAWSRAVERGEDAPALVALGRNMVPIAVSHLTTAFGFFCLMQAPSPPLRDLGLIVAFGLIFGLLLVLTLMPIGLARREGRASARGFWRVPRRVPRSTRPSSAAMTAFGAAVLARKRWFLIGFPAVLVLAVIGLTRLEFDDSLARYFDHRYVFRQDIDVIQDRLSGTDTLEFSFRAAPGDNVFTPQFLADVDRFATWIADQPGVTRITALPFLLKRVNQSLGADDGEGSADTFRLADTQAGNAQLLMLYEMSLPYGADLNALLDVARAQTLVSVGVTTSHARELRGLAAEAEMWLADNAPALATRASGGSIAFARVAASNSRQMLAGLFLALMLVSATLMITLRDVRLGLISLVPNLIPAVLAFGLWGFVLRDLNLGATVVTTMTFGIVVDDTVHFLMSYQKQRAQGDSVEAALSETFSSVGASIVVTSLTVFVGFGLMAASGFAINTHIGLLTASVVAAALLADLLLLPSLLLAFEERRL